MPAFATALAVAAASAGGIDARPAVERVLDVRHHLP
jgi:hypothetical protein